MKECYVESISIIPVSLSLSKVEKVIHTRLRQAQADSSLKAQADSSLKAQADSSLKAQADSSLKAQADSSLKAQADSSLKAQTDSYLYAQAERDFKVSRCRNIEIAVKVTAEQFFFQ